MDGARQAKVYPGALGLDEPVSWDQLVAYVKEGSVDALGNMGRGKASQNTYAAFKAKVQRMALVWEALPAQSIDAAAPLVHCITLHLALRNATSVCLVTLTATLVALDEAMQAACVIPVPSSSKPCISPLYPDNNRRSNFHRCHKIMPVWPTTSSARFWGTKQ